MAETAKQAILRALRREHPAPVELPEFDQPAIRYDDPVAQFCQVLQAVGGRAERVAHMGHVEERLLELPAYRDAKKICSLIGGIGKSNVDLETVDDPHELEDVDFLIAPAEFAVAENGAVWCTDARIKHRAAYFIVQHLVLVVPAAELVHNMHEAYARLEFRQRGFGLFLSGPSKTADIEQSLVIGAHGARSLTVVLVRDPN